MKHWFLFTLRSARKHSAFTFINVLSLALGFACSLTILLYVNDDLSFDSFHSSKEKIFRIVTKSTYNGDENQYTRTPVPLGEKIVHEAKDVEHCARVNIREATIYIEEKKEKVLEKNFCFADRAILEIFSFRFLYGDRHRALENINSVVLTETAARRLFGDPARSIGQTLIIENSFGLIVSAVVEDWPSQSHIRPEIIAHFDQYFSLENSVVRQYLQDDWLYTSVFTYVSLNDALNQEIAESQINNIRRAHADERVRTNVSYALQPLRDIHLYSDFNTESGGAKVKYIYILSSVGILTMIIACFNFVNLSIARSLKRIREIAIRRSMGIDKRTLIMQLLGEATLYVISAFITSIGMVAFALPAINTMAGKELALAALFSTHTIPTVITLLVLCSLISGGYPAFYLTNITTYEALKGQLHKPQVLLPVRRVLVTLQFVLAMTLVLFALFINRQLTFIREAPLGFNQEHVITIPLFSESFNSILGSRIDADYRKRMLAFEEELLKSSHIESITCTSFLPGQGAITALVKTDSIREESNVFIPLVSVDYDFISAYKISLLAGRDFSKETGTDHLQAFIVNEEAVQKLGYKSSQHSIGKPLSAVGKDGFIVGVISNYHFQGLQYAVQPLVLEVSPGKFSTFSIRINPHAVQESIQDIRNQWDKFFPETVFQYSFLDEELAKNYESDEVLSNIIQHFSIFAYLIAGMGLFGLAAYINQTRLKEVGIRKVLGASTSSVFMTLSLEFVKLICIAFIICIPLSMFVTNEWLNQFHYRTAITLVFFPIVLASTGIVVLLAITYQTLRVAGTNPASVLINE